MKTQHRQATDTQSIPLNPKRRCDIVMKGGITSGVVYPLAVCELAKEYRFVNIGGTSAGAIAASLTAAAEYRRSRGSVAGFEEGISTLPRELAAIGPDHTTALFSLFQPDRLTRPVFRVITACLTGKRWTTKLRTVFQSLFAVSPIAAPACLLLSLCMVVVMWLVGRTVTPFLAIPVILVLSIVSAAPPVYLLVLSAKKVAGAIAANGFGVCSGNTGEDSGGKTKPLTEWLADLLDTIAGRTDPRIPLTFGDLWGNPRADLVAPGKRVINLQTIATSVSHGRPYQLPFEMSTFYFSPSEFRKYFPGRIVDWMVQHSAAQEQGDVRSFPPPGKLPVIVAARMSLSFPLLISAIPLYAADWSLGRNKERRETGRPPELERCWFSDGGICSNFPVHFFDSPLPRWPTFAINLRQFSGDYQKDPDDANNVWMPRTNGEGTLEQWYRFEKTPGAASVAGFFGAILETMQNWTDNSQLKVPGYRDRVAHVFLGDDEGGLNLTMPQEVLARVSERGRIAGEKLRRRFTGKDRESVLDWDNHRWVRYRSTMSLVEDYLSNVCARYSSAPPPDERSYRELATRGLKQPPASYRFHKRQQVVTHRLLEQLVRLMRAPSSPTLSFRHGTPRPIPELRIRPKM